MSLLFTGLHLSDVNLRLAGTWALALSTDGWQPVYINEVFGECTPSNEYYDTKAHAIRGAWPNIRSATKEVTDLRYHLPQLGYIELAGYFVYVSKLPERQTRAGLPPRTIVVREREGVTFLEDRSDAAKIVERLYTPQTHTIVQGAQYLINHECAVLGGTLYGPWWLELGEVREELGDLVVTTKHPETVATLLGAQYA